MPNKQIGLIILLILQSLALFIYTFYVGVNEGWNFMEVAVANVISWNWNGQFNLDFSCYLILSGLWILWRNKFTVPSMIIAIAAMVLGIVVFAPYLLYLIFKEKGHLRSLLVGDR